MCTRMLRVMLWLWWNLSIVSDFMLGGLVVLGVGVVGGLNPAAMQYDDHESFRYRL